MKITRITLWQVPLTSHETYYMAGGKTCDTTISVLLRLDTDTGLSGWGEVCPIPHYLPAYAGGVIPAVEEMAPVLLGADPVGPQAVMERLERHLLGAPLRQIRHRHGAVGSDRSGGATATLCAAGRAAGRGHAALSFDHLRCPGGDGADG